MARGDIFTDKVSVADDALMTIRPTNGQEASVHNIGWAFPGTDPTKVEIYRCDGTSDMLIADYNTMAALGLSNGMLSVVFHVTYNDYLKVKNVSGTTGYGFWDGVITKEA